MVSVLHIYKDYYPPVIGGVEKHINEVAQGTKDEFEVRVLIANTHPRTEFREIQGIPVIKAASLGRIASAPICPTFPRLLKTYSADILHFHCPNPTGDISYLIAKPKGKVAVTYHSDVVRQTWAMFAYGLLLRRFLNKADIILPTSPLYIDSSPYLSRVREKCTPVPLGIDTARFEKTPVIQARADEIKKTARGEQIILFVGRLRYYKGLHFLIQAMPMIDAHLFIIGSGSEENAIRKQIRLFKVMDRVTLTGAVNDEELVAYYHAADVFCLPSHLRSEAYGLVQLEAMACGVPVVSCDLKTGVPFVNQDGVTGIIVPCGSPSKLASALNTLLNDDALRQRLGEQARERVFAEFDISLMIRRIKDAYHRVLEER